MCMHKKIRMIAFDLDGTTLQRGNVLSERNRQAMEKAAAAGVYVVPSTGRIVSFLPPCLTELPGIRYAITSNGAAVWDMQENRDRAGVSALHRAVRKRPVGHAHR